MHCPLSSGGRAAFVVAASMSAAVQAAVTNPRFEAGASKNATAINGWASVGDAFLSETSNFSTPTNGTYQATLARATDGNYGEHAGAAATAAAAETFLGISAGSLSGVGNGIARTASAIRQTIHLNVGDKLTFDYDFLTNEIYKAINPANASFEQRPATDRNDFAFLSYAADGTAGVVKLIDTFYGYSSTGAGQSAFNTGFVPTPDTDPLFAESKYLAYAFTATATGDYAIGRAW